jgi:metallo-beta-lactamase family protein
MATNDDDRSPVLTFLGAAGTVTGSRFLLDTAGGRVLVDAGLFQGLKNLRLRNRAPFPVDPSTIDAVVVTHAHLDHVGYLPVLVDNGFAGPVLATPGTIDLAGIVLADSARLQEEEADYANRHGFSKHAPALPLYTEESARRALRQFRPVGYGQPVEACRGLTVCLQPAGHILGSATLTVTIDGPAPRTLFFSGDLGRPRHPLLNPPAPPAAANIAVVESTYGDRRHEDEARALDRFARAVVDTAGRGGMVVIPAFAVDRTEVILMALRRLAAENRIPVLPVYADSPMALDVLGVYRRAIADHDPQIRAEILAADGDPFDPGKLEEVRSPQDSMELHGLPGPAIIISASGMVTGGRVLHHLAHRLPDPRNTVVLPGFQADGSRGRQLADGARAVKMLGRYVPVRADIVPIDAFSVHADASELLAWLGPMPPPEVTFIVHGSPEASQALRKRLASRRGWTAVVPAAGERVRVD